MTLTSFSSMLLTRCAACAALLLVSLALYSCAEKYDGYVIGKVHLGLTSEEVLELYPARGLDAELKWMRDGDTGQIFAKPQDGATDRQEDFVLLGNRVIQFTSFQPLDEKRFEQTVAGFQKRYGEPIHEPPHFARHNAYLRGLKDNMDEFEQLHFWGKEERGEVLSASFSREKNQMYFLVFDPRAYNRLDQEARESNLRRQQMVEETNRRRAEQEGATAPDPGADEGGAGGSGNGSGAEPGQDGK